MTIEITLSDRHIKLLHTAYADHAGKALPAAQALGIRGGAFETMSANLVNKGMLEEKEGELHLTEMACTLIRDERGDEGTAHSAPETPETDINVTPPTEEQAAAEQSESEITAQSTETEALTDETAKTETPADVPAPKVRKQRDSTKQSKVIEMLKRPEGATITQIVEATGWAIHTTRAVLSRTIQKDLGIPLVSEKSQGEERIYRVKKEKAE